MRRGCTPTHCACFGPSALHAWAALSTRMWLPACQLLHCAELQAEPARLCAAWPLAQPHMMGTALRAGPCAGCAEDAVQAGERDKPQDGRGHQGEPGLLSTALLLHCLPVLLESCPCCGLTRQLSLKFKLKLLSGLGVYKKTCGAAHPRPAASERAAASKQALIKSTPALPPSKGQSP